MYRSLLLAGAACPCLLAVPAAAQDVVVTATRTPQPLADTAASVAVVSAADIARTPARTIDDVLRRVASVDLPFAGTGEQHPTDTIVSMRGLGGIRALVLLDGVPLNDSFFGYVQWSEVPIGTVERIEVVRGGGAPLWGNDAMGGVVNILTRPLDRDVIEAQAAGGSRSTYRIDGRAAVTSADTGIGIGIDGGITHTDGYLEQAAGYRGPIDVPTASTARTVAVSGNAALSPTLSIRARTGWYANDQDFLTRLQTNRQRNWRTTASIAWAPDAATTLTLSGFHVFERFVTNNTGAPDGADPLAAEYVQNRHRTTADDWGAAVTARHGFDGVLRSLSAGVDYHATYGRDSAAILDQTGAFLRTDLGAGDQRFLGGYLQAELRPAGPLLVLLSVRYQDFLNSGGIDASPGGFGRVPSRHDGDIDPRLSARLQLPAGFALRGAWYRAFRAPTLDNLYRSASVPGYVLYANAALRPETLAGGEVGINYDHGTLRVQATAYSSTIDGFLTYRYLDPATLPPGFATGARLINAGTARSRGVEAELRWAPSPRLSATVSYTFADAIVTRNPEDPASVGVQQAGVPRHKVAAGIDWTAPCGLILSPRLRYAAATNGDPDDLYRTDPHVVADLGASLPAGRRLTLFVQAENLFDRRYVATNDGFTAPLYGRPRTILAGVRTALGHGDR